MDIGLFDKEVQFLEELAGDLADTLNVIAFAGHAANEYYIKNAQKHLRETYQAGFNNCFSMTFTLRVLPAYDTIMELTKIKNIKERRQIAEETFYDLILNEEDT